MYPHVDNAAHNIDACTQENTPTGTEPLSEQDKKQAAIRAAQAAADAVREAQAALVEEGRLLFKKSWIFIRGVPSMKFLPPEGPVEIAFAGRSNVGKSSLINALVNKKGLARTSNTPGRTQELNYFVPDGYSGENGDLPPLALIAARHGIKKNDAEVLDLLDKAAVSYQIVLTKIDKIKPAGVPRLLEETHKLTYKRAACFPGIIATSSEKGVGLDELRAAIALVTKE